jgi:aspartate 1-decarboxylase
LGAQRARGCGEVNGSATFKNADGDVLAVVRFGELQPANIEWTAIGTQLTEKDKTAQPA